MYFCEKLTYQLSQYVATPKHSIPYLNGKCSIPEKKSQQGRGWSGGVGMQDWGYETWRGIEEKSKRNFLGLIKSNGELPGVIKKKSCGMSRSLGFVLSGISRGKVKNLKLPWGFQISLLKCRYLPIKFDYNFGRIAT